MSQEVEACVPETEDKRLSPPATLGKIHPIPALGCPAPSWTSVAVANLKFQNLSLQDYKGKYLVLVFYPYDFTFMCPIELTQFSDRLDEFQDQNCDVVAISTDSEYSHFAWISMPRKMGGLGGIRIPVVADKAHEISKNYGVLDEKEGISLKALFVIDKKQLIRHVAINDISVARSVDEILRIVQSCQYADLTSATCPLGSSPSKIVKIKEYFNVN